MSTANPAPFLPSYLFASDPKIREYVVDVEPKPVVPVNEERIVLSHPSYQVVCQAAKDADMDVDEYATALYGRPTRVVCSVTIPRRRIWRRR